jgi:hypothetical protein
MIACICGGWIELLIALGIGSVISLFPVKRKCSCKKGKDETNTR